jgi:hypothetical protein
MSKKTENAPIAQMGKARIVGKAFVTMYLDAGNSSTLMSRVLAVARDQFGVSEIARVDVEQIALSAAAQSDWKESTAKTRKSEIRKIVRARLDLLAAMKAFAEKNHGECYLVSAVKIARKINDWNANYTGSAATRIKESVALALQTPPPTNRDTKAYQSKAASLLIERLLGMKRTPPAFRKAIVEARGLLTA